MKNPFSPPRQSILAVAEKHNLASANSLYTHPLTLATRIFTDDFATDSFQNVYFPLLQFPVYLSQSPFAFASTCASSRSPTYVSRSTGGCQSPAAVIPRHTHLISHAFKRPRFTTLHFPTVSSLLSFPIDTQAPSSTSTHPSPQLSFTFHGIDPPFTPSQRTAVEAAEREKGVEAWRADPRGEGAVLRGKREGRGWSESSQRAFEELVGRVEGGWGIGSGKGEGRGGGASGE
ncbi:MAG: hypothetical protein Q9160_001891 [Pyrenula sp. 1 TL-2023]